MCTLTLGLHYPTPTYMGLLASGLIGFFKHGRFLFFKKIPIIVFIIPKGPFY